MPYTLVNSQNGNFFDGRMLAEENIKLNLLMRTRETNNAGWSFRGRWDESRAHELNL